MSVFPRQKNYGADLMEIMHGGPRSTATVEESDDQPRVGNALLQAMGRRPSQPAEPTGMPRMNLAASGIESRLGSAGMSMYGQQPPITMPMPAPVQLSPVAQTATPPAPFPQMDMQASGIERQLQAGGMNLYGRQPLPDPPDMSGLPSKPLQPMTPEERQLARDVARYGPDYASTGDLPPIVGIGHALARTGANIARLPHTLREVAGSVIAESANRAAAGRPYPKVPFVDELADALTGAPRPAPAPIQQAMGMVAEAGQALAIGDPMQQAQTGFIDQMRQLPRSQSAEGFQPDKPAWWIENVTEALPYIGMTFATGGIGAASGLGATGSILLATVPTMGVEAQDSLLTIADQLEAQGMTRQQAMNAAAPYAAGVGVVAGAFEAVPAAELLTDGPMGRALKQRLAKMVSERLANVAGRGSATAVAESVTEIGQELTQVVGEFAATGDPAVFDNLDTRLKAAGTIGGVVGGGTGVVTTPVIGQQDRIAPPTSPAAPPTVPTTPQPKPDGDTPSTDDIASLKYVQLRELAEAMGLDKRGSHAVLVERIREAQRRSTPSEPQQPPVEPQRAATTEEPTPESFGLSEAARTGYSRFEELRQLMIDNHVRWEDIESAMGRSLDETKPSHQAIAHNYLRRNLNRIIERRPVTEPADTEMQELIYAEFRADEPSKRSTPESFRDEFPEGESSPFEFTLPEGIKLREGIGPDIMEAARMIAVPVKSKKLRGLMLGVFRHPPGMIELRDIRWIRTLAHEAGHAVDFRMNGNSFPSSIRNRFPTLQLKEREAREQLKRASEFIRPLQGMSWSDRSSYVRYRAGHAELMADLICLYQLAPDKARELAPDVTAALEAKIESNPIVKAAMDLVLNPDEAGIKATAKKHIAERTTLPDPEFVDPTNPEPMLRADVLDLVKQTNRELGVHLHRVYSTSRKWREQLNAREREDVAAFVEGISNLSVKGDTFEAVESRMTPAMHAAAREYRYEQELNRQEANRIFHEAGEGPEKIKWIADYLAHFYMAPRAKLVAFLGRWRKQTPHIKKRQFPTLKEAVEAGLVPVSQDIAYLYERAAENNFRAAMTRHFLKQLRAKKTLAGDPVIVGSIEAAGPDWRRIEHPVLRTIYARKNARGETILGENFAYVHPSIERPVQVLLDRQFDGPVARIITAINSAGKALNVAFSFFHEITLYESSSAVNMKFLNPLRGVLIGPFESKRLGIGFRPHLTYRAGLKLDRKDPHGTQDAIRHGLSLTRAASADYARSYLETMLRRVEHVARKVPQLEWLVRRVRKAVESYNRHLWDNAHQGLKLFSYHTLAADILPKLPRGISAREAKETIASYVNDAFGGQEFLEIPVLKKGHRAFSEPATVKQVQLLHGLLFAPDWTISNIRIAGRPVVNIRHPLMRRLGAQYWRNMVVTLFGSMAAVQYAIYWALGSDDDDMKPFPWQNEIGRTTSIDVTPLRNRIHTVLGIEPPKERAYIHPGKQAFEVLRYFEQFPEGLVQNIGNKSSVAVRMAVEQMTSHQAGLGFPMPWANDAYGEQINGWAEIVERAKAVGEQFIPFSWQPNNFAFALPKQSGMTKYRAGRHYEDAITAYADPSWWNAIGQSVGLKSQEAAAIDMIAKVHDAAVANGIEPEASRQLFIMAMNRVRGVYYGKFLDAIEDQDWNAADRYAVVLLNLGTEPRQVAASARRRSRSELSAEAESYLRSAGVRDRTLNFDDLVR